MSTKPGGVRTEDPGHGQADGTTAPIPPVTVRTSVTIVVPTGHMGAKG